MELRQLKYFAATARYLSFSEAARKLYISQSTLSQQIRQLEDELGAPLFERSTHNVTLTEAGESLLPLAQRTLKAADDCKMQIRDLNHMLTGTLKIGVTRFIRPVFSDTAKKFMKEYPGVRLSIFYNTEDKVIEMLRNQEIDLALSFLPEEAMNDIDSQVLFEDKLCVVVRKDNILADKNKLTLQDIYRHRLAIPAKGIRARALLDKYIDLNDSNLDIKVEVNAPGIIMDFVELYNFVTILSSSITRYYPNLKAIELDVPDGRLYGCAHTLKDNYIKYSTKVFLNMLRESDAIQDMLES